MKKLRSYYTSHPSSFKICNIQQVIFQIPNHTRMTRMLQEQTLHAIPYLYTKGSTVVVCVHLLVPWVPLVAFLLRNTVGRFSHIHQKRVDVWQLDGAGVCYLTVHTQTCLHMVPVLHINAHTHTHTHSHSHTQEALYIFIQMMVHYKIHAVIS